LQEEQTDTPTGGNLDDTVPEKSGEPVETSVAPLNNAPVHDEGTYESPQPHQEDGSSKGKDASVSAVSK